MNKISVIIKKKKINANLFLILYEDTLRGSQDEPEGKALPETKSARAMRLGSVTITHKHLLHLILI